MTLVCYFHKPTQDTGSPVPEGGGTARVRLGMGVLVWSIDGKSSRDTNQYFQGQMKIPRASKLVVSRSWAVSLSCHFPPQVPFISSRNPPIAALFLGLFIIEIENGGAGVGCVQLGIWQQPMIVRWLLSRCSSPLFCTSLAPLCVWGSVCVRA